MIIIIQILLNHNTILNVLTKSIEAFLFIKKIDRKYFYNYE